MAIDVLVLGGGIAGLTAAYYLNQRGHNTLIVEKSDQAGGRVRTFKHDNIYLDEAAQFYANFYTSTFRLMEELKIIDQLRPIETSNAVVSQGRIYTLPPYSFEIHKLLPWTEQFKLMMIMLDVYKHYCDLDMQNVQASYILDTESVHQFALDRNIESLLMYLFEPLLRGILYWDSSSTTKAFLYVLLRYTPFLKLYTMEEGIATLVHALSEHVEIRLDSYAKLSVYHPETKKWKTIVQKEGIEETIESKVVVCTIPASYVNDVFTLPPDPKSFFSHVSYSSTVAVHFFLDNSLALPKHYGIFYATSETDKIAAVTVQSRKKLDNGIQGKEVISVFTTSEFSEQLIPLSDKQIVGKILEILRTLYPFSELELYERITLTRVTRLSKAVPRFEVGHIRRIKNFSEKVVHDLPSGLFFAGDYLGGPSIEGAVVSAERIVPHIHQFLK